MESSNQPSFGDNSACHENINMNQLEVEINSLECPFTWLPDRSSFAHVNSEYIIEASKHNDGNSSLSKYVKFTRLIYELAHIGSEEVWEKLEEWKTFFAQVTEDAFFEKYSHALEHILFSSEAVLMFKNGNYTQVVELLQIIQKIPIDGAVSRAGFRGMKAKFFNKYGFEGHRIGLPLAREALSLCEDEPQWIYMIAKSMRDIRRAEMFNRENEDGSLEEELKLFEKLITLDNKPIYFIRCGTTCHDFAIHLCEKHKRNKKHTNTFSRQGCHPCQEIGNYCNKGVDYLKEAVSVDKPIKKKTYLNLITAVNNIPKFIVQRYKATAKKWAKEIECQCTDKHDWFRLGKYYQYVEQDMSKAEEYFIKAAALGSLNGKKEVIIINYKNNPDYNPCEDIVKRLEMYPDRLKTVESFCQITSYYLLIKEQLLEAVEAFKQVIENDPRLESKAIKNHKSWFLRMSGTENLLDILVHDVLQYLNEQRERSQIQETLLDFLERLERINPDLVKDSQDPEKIMKLKDLKYKQQEKSKASQKQQSVQTFKEREGQKNDHSYCSSSQAVIGKTCNKYWAKNEPKNKDVSWRQQNDREQKSKITENWRSGPRDIK